MMNFVEMPLQAIEPHLSAMGYMFKKEITLGGGTWLANYENPDTKKGVQLTMRLYAQNSFCKDVCEYDIEE